MKTKNAYEQYIESKTIDQRDTNRKKTNKDCKNKVRWAISH